MIAEHDKLNATCFEKEIRGIGAYALRPLNLHSDLHTLHEWLNSDHARYWMMQDTTPEEVRMEFESMIVEGHKIYVGSLNGDERFIAVIYDPRNETVGMHYDYEPGDFGMHVLVGPPEKPIHNFTWGVFKIILGFMFCHHEVKRVVVEPDEGNEKVHRLNRRAGFQYIKKAFFPEKTAAIALCTRAQYIQALTKNS